jgi:6-phosphogluconolactonase
VRLRRFAELRSWIEAVAEDLRAALACAASEGRPLLRLCLAGGSTPAPVYRALAALLLAGPRIELWLGDERAVPPEGPERNGRLVEECFSATAWNPAPRLRLWPAADPADPKALERACRAYEAALFESAGAAAFDPPGSSGAANPAAFDLCLLGLGADGHTASLFPGDAALQDQSRLALAARAPSPPRDRLTLGLRALASTRRLRFLPAGEGKAAAVEGLLAGDPSMPASLIRVTDAEIYWLVP